MNNTRVVVIIEDEALLRLQAAELFDLAGLPAQTFESGEEAIAFVRDNEADVACIFTDLKLGSGPDGMAVVRYVSSTLPRVPIVLTSGQLPERPDDLPETVRFLAKPWQPFDVINAVRDAELDND
ncbi:response regulator [Lichenihabitans sp. Uapishka_5]|uniref:response regulator n=1 Tax=Lichenihabitans sp. Uapishka_5 TaxID=3037302 RepID=UPI0029E7D1D0|nr:response regulator [Lichenihabitans sp. Uapishka_5]MDX7953287.1 response regulator [Lichenihabitans sp. Uapishka_5]